MSEHLMNTYSPLPVRFVRGQGATLTDSEGRDYLDAVSGIAVCGLGHAHPAVGAALCDQAQKLLHTSNLYHIENQERLADALCRVADMDRAFFCNSGAEANEAAIKLARLYGHRKDIDTPQVIVTEGSFHGRTLATLSATGNRRIQAGFEPLVPGFLRAPYDDLDAIHTIAASRSDVVAVLVEPIIGEGGVRMPADDYLPQLRELCDRRGWLLMLDEVQTGMGRTGRWFAHQHSGIRPDVMTLAKALGNGVPIGACIARGTAATVFQPGNHGSTFGGNPLTSRAALAVVETLERDGLIERAARLGERMRAGFAARLDGLEGVVSVRGRGLMLGIELDRPCAGLVGQALQQGLLINVTAGNVVRLLPPLVISDNEADRIVELTTGLVAAFLQEAAA